MAKELERGKCTRCGCTWSEEKSDACPWCSHDHEGGKHYGKVYDLLVKTGGANEKERVTFIHSNLDPRNQASSSNDQEWRFMGFLGFGGKYSGRDNFVWYHPNDITPERQEIVRVLNEELHKLS